MRGEEGEKGGEGRMVMMCLHMICRLDITNHLVLMVTPLGHTLIRPLLLIHTILSPSYINLINISHLHFFQRHSAYLKGCSFVCVCTPVCVVCLIHMCMCLPVHVIVLASVFLHPELSSLVHEHLCSRLCMYVCTSVCVWSSGEPSHLRLAQ